MAIAGSEVGLARTEAALTPDWLTRVLHASGALDPDCKVLSADIGRIGEGVGLLSRLFRVTLAYDAPGAGPASVVVKLPTEDPAMRFLANSLNAYAREVKFYREVAEGAPFKSPACHAAMIDEAGDFVLVLEDVSGLTPLDQIAGCSYADAEKVCDTLADFHAQWWGHASLDDHAETFWPMRNAVYPQLLPAMFGAGWPQARANAADIVEGDLGRYGDAWPVLCHWLFDQISERQTLLHADFRADNLFLDDGRILALDFQITSVGPGIYDLAYFVSQSVKPEARAGRDRELVARYIARMARHGIVLDEAETWRLYQLSLAYCLIYPIAVFQSWEVTNERGRELMRTLLGRCGTAIVQTGALAAIPESAWKATAPV